MVFEKESIFTYFSSNSKWNLLMPSYDNHNQCATSGNFPGCFRKRMEVLGHWNASIFQKEWPHSQ